MKNLFSSFCVVLLTNQPKTNSQTWLRKHNLLEGGNKGEMSLWLNVLWTMACFKTNTFIMRGTWVKPLDMGYFSRSHLPSLAHVSTMRVCTLGGATDTTAKNTRDLFLEPGLIDVVLSEMPMYKHAKYFVTDAGTVPRIGLCNYFSLYFPPDGFWR